MKLLRPAVAFALVLAAGGARAQSVPANGEERAVPPAPGTGYRLEVIASDAISVGAMIAGGEIEGNHAFNPLFSDVLRGGGLGGYALGGPIIHMAHRQYYRGAISLALRVGLPTLGAVIGAQTASCTPGEWFCGVGEAAVGALIGAATAATVDSVFVVPSAASAPPEPAHAAARPSGGVRLSPQLVATPNVAVLGIGGQF